MNSDLRTLQAWRRRSLSSQHKISLVRRFVGSNQYQDRGTESTDSDVLLDDYTYVAERIDAYAHRLESMLPIVTSMVQVVDSRRSFAEIANVSRLTYLALIFIPLTFTSGLFSMNAENAPGGERFWVYFVVAVPMTMTVFLLAQPATRDLRGLYAYMRKPQKSRFPV